MTRLLNLLTIALLLLSPCLADEGYIRLVRGADGKPTELQTAIARFAAKNGTTVDLVGVIHVGDQVYYQKLDKHFNNYQSVLYEMILDVPKSVSHQNDVRELLGRERKEPRVDTTKGGRDSLSLFQQKLADVLDRPEETISQLIGSLAMEKTDLTDSLLGKIRREEPP